MKIALLIFIALLGCTKLDPNPELKDPIFKDIENELAGARKEKEELEKLVLEANEEYKKVLPQSGQYKIKLNAVFDLEKKIQIADQKIHYLLVRLDSRKYQANVDYRKAYASSKEWPDPAEYKKYVMEKNLSLPSNNFYQNRIHASEVGAKTKTKAKTAEH